MRLRLLSTGLIALTFYTFLPHSPCIAAAASDEPTAEKMAMFAARRSGFPGGVCVVLGPSNAELAVALSQHGRFVVHALCDDHADLQRARKLIDAHGVYGRVSADLSPYDRLPYAENLVNVVVADRYPVLASEGLAVDEVLRVLAPLGVAFFGDSGSSAESMPQWAAVLRRELAAAGIEDVEVIKENGISSIQE